MKTLPKLALLCLLSLSLTACGGGGSDDSKPEPAPEVGETPESGGSGSDSPGSQFLRSGLYAGRISLENVSGDSIALVAVTDEYARFVERVEGSTYARGILEMDSAGFTGVITEFQGDFTSEGLLKGTYSENQWAGVAYDQNGDARSQFEFVRVPEFSDIPSTIETVNGTWTNSAEGGSTTTTLTVGSEGALTGSDSTGCVLDGLVETPQPNVNIYDTEITYSNCSRDLKNGQYQGLAYYAPAHSGDGEHWVILQDNEEVDGYLKLSR